jgi:hypothetical protein
VVPKLDRLIENMIQVGFSLGNKGHQQYPWWSTDLGLSCC